MARVKRNEIEMERKNNAKEEEIQQVLQDRYNAAQAKIENKRQESNAILKLNKEYEMRIQSIFDMEPLKVSKIVKKRWK